MAGEKRKSVEKVFFVGDDVFECLNFAGRKRSMLLVWFFGDNEQKNKKRETERTDWEGEHRKERD